MLCDTHGPFPAGAVRDLLVIARALYRATPPPHSTRRDRPEAIGQQLTLPLDLARRSGIGTPLGRRAAWSHADQATAALREPVADGAIVEALVRTAAERIRRRA
jgi:hypothetical protein